MATLKVYRTPIGFHDAYVAAPSKKAALRAWGSDKDLFAHGAAEIVTDAELAAPALAEPGVVIKRSRGTTAEQIAALPPNAPRKSATRQGDDPVPRTAPRPDRSTLDAATRELAALEQRHTDERREIDKRLAALRRKRDIILREQAAQHATAEQARERAAQAYDDAMRAWRG